MTDSAKTNLNGSGASSQWKHYPDEPAAPRGAPNIILILTDDVGFGATSTFGGPIPTPTFDALAATGLRYNEFHTTAMCSPTRAALLTGRNHHAVGSGAISNVSTDDEGYTSIIPKSAATIGRVLKDNGYDTAWFGKNHNTPTWETGPMGPFDRWPNAWGFDYFYGFHGAMADQFHPALIENRNVVQLEPDESYHLDADLADHVIHWLQMQYTIRPDRPAFVYWAPGTLHSPHQAPADWIARFKGKFDQGWDRLREETHKRQREMGVIPPDAALTPRMEGLSAWDDLSDEERRIYARMMEAAAGQLAHCDHQIGRVVEHLRNTGQLDNTLIIYIQGDNGASIESPFGATNELRSLFGLEPTLEEIARDFDKIGGPDAFCNYPAAWAWATNAPFPWGKQVASHLGGLRDGMVMSWPARIRGGGEVRTQFGHVIDIAPTIYEAAGIKPPKSVDGIKQQPIDGISMVYTFDDADAPEQHREQYFEMLGNRSYYKDGWLASTVPGRPPWDRSPAPVDPETFDWELYDLNTDYSQSKDVAEDNPQKLSELKAAFDTAARTYHVYPLTSGLLGRLGAEHRPDPIRGRTRFVYRAGETLYPGNSMPGLRPGWRLSATVEITDDSPEGTILVQGDLFSGQSLLLEAGCPVFLHNPLGGTDHLKRLAATQSLAKGRHHIEIEADSAGAKAANFTLRIDGAERGAMVVEPFYASRGSGYVGRPGDAPFLPGRQLPAPSGFSVETIVIERQAQAD